MKNLLFFLLAVTAASLHAAPQKVQFDCTLISSSKPMFGDLDNAYAQLAQSRPAGAKLPPDHISVNGIFTAEQTQIMLERLRRDKARITDIGSETVTSRRTAQINTMRKGPPAVEVLGDFAKYGIQPVKLDAPERHEIGLRLTGQPTVGPDGHTIDCKFSYRSRRLKGFDETLLTGDETTWARLSAVSASPDFPRIRQAIYASQYVTTNVTLYDGNTIVFALRDKSADPTAAFYEYALISARILK